MSHLMSESALVIRDGYECHHKPNFIMTICNNHQEFKMMSIRRRQRMSLCHSQSPLTNTFKIITILEIFLTLLFVLKIGREKSIY